MEADKEIIRLAKNCGLLVKGQSLKTVRGAFELFRGAPADTEEAKNEAALHRALAQRGF